MDAAASLERPPFRIRKLCGTPPGWYCLGHLLLQAVQLGLEKLNLLLERFYLRSGGRFRGG